MTMSMPAPAEAVFQSGIVGGRVRKLVPGKAAGRPF